MSATAAISEIPVGNGILGQNQAGRVCARYLSIKNFRKDGSRIDNPGRYVDGILLTDRRALLESDTATGEISFVFKAKLAASVCSEIGNQAPPSPGMINGFLQNLQGKTPTPNDFGLAVVAIQKTTNINDVRYPRIMQDRFGGLDPFEVAIKSSSFMTDENGQITSEIEFRFNLKDLLKKAKKSYWDDYLNKKEMHISMTMSYCSTDIRKGTVDGRPPFRIEEVVKVNRITDGGTARAVNSDCFIIGNPVHVVLNDEGGNSGGGLNAGDNPLNPSQPVPEPTGVFLDIMNQFADAAASQPISLGEMNGWHSSRCYYRMNGGKPNADLPANYLLIARSMVEKTGVVFYRDTSGSQSNSQQNPAFYDNLSSSDEKKIRKSLEETYPLAKGIPGHLLTSYEEGYLETSDMFADRYADIVTRFRKTSEGIIFIRYKYPPGYGHYQLSLKGDQGVPYVACRTAKKIREN